MLYFLTFSRQASVPSPSQCIQSDIVYITFVAPKQLGTVAQAMASKVPVSFKNGASIDRACIQEMPN